MTFEDAVSRIWVHTKRRCGFQTMKVIKLLISLLDGELYIFKCNYVYFSKTNLLIYFQVSWLHCSSLFGDTRISLSVMGHSKKVLLSEYLFLYILHLLSFCREGGKRIQVVLNPNNCMYNLYIAPKTMHSWMIKEAEDETPSLL